jgi:hypothetical protein
VGTLSLRRKINGNEEESCEEKNRKEKNCKEKDRQKEVRRSDSSFKV